MTASVRSNSYRTFAFRLLAGLLIFVQASTAAAFPVCKNLLREKFLDREFEVTRITNIPVRSGYVWRPTIFPNSDEVFLGIHDEHAYLVVDSIRYDGELRGKRFQVRNDVSTLSTGLVLRFKDLSPESIKTLKNHFSGLSGGISTSATCYHGICEELASSGLRLGGDAGKTKRPSDLFQRMIFDGFKDQTGERVAFEIYEIGSQTLESIHRGLRGRESSHIKDKAFEYGVFVAIGGFFVLLIVALVKMAPDETKKPQEALPKPSDINRVRGFTPLKE